MTLNIKNLQEKNNAKLSALVLLIKLGWNFLSAEKVGAVRNNNSGQVILSNLLRNQLLKHRFTFAGKEYPFSEKSIENVISEITNPTLNEGSLAANEKIYNHLLYGISVTEFVDGKKINTTIALIDWLKPGNNSFTFTEDFNVACVNEMDVLKQDIVCFVNGIPFVVIQCSGINSGISYSLYNQRYNQIPQLFAYSQLLLAIDGQQGRYGVCGLPANLWASWYEEDISDLQIQKLNNKRLSSKQKNTLLEWCPEPDLNRHVQFQGGNLSISDQDRLLTGLLSPERLLEMTQHFNLFDKKNERIIACAHQVFASKRIVEHLVPSGKGKVNAGPTKDGIIYHTTDKSLSLVFLTRVLLQHPSLKQYRIFVLTDATSLEDELSNIFMSGNKLLDKKQKQSAMATSGRRLVEEISYGNQKITFALIEKFNTAIKLPECANASQNIIFLIKGFPNTEIQNRMKVTLPHAAFIAVTDCLFEGDKTRGEWTLIHSYVKQSMDEISKPDPYEIFIQDITPYGYMLKNFSNEHQKGIREPVSIYQVDSLEKQVDIPVELNANQAAQDYFLILKNILFKNFITIDKKNKNHWIKLVLEIDQIVLISLVENSISFQNAEKNIRKQLLPLLFMEVKTMDIGMDQVKEIIEMILKIVQAHFNGR